METYVADAGLGMSTRLAFDLGLHIDMTPYVEKGEIGAFEADVRRIAFWGSYTADQYVCLTRSDVSQRSDIVIVFGAST